MPLSLAPAPFHTDVEPCERDAKRKSTFVAGAYSKNKSKVAELFRLFNVHTVPANGKQTFSWLR